ncbi:hypothetical protein AHYW_004190 [Providencia manganoxydans]
MKNAIFRNSDYLFLVICCSFISFNSLPINLTYILGFILICFGILTLILKLKVNKLTCIYFIFSTIFILSQFTGLFIANSLYSNEINYLSPLLFYFSWLISIFIPNIIPNTLPYDRKKIYLRAINVSLVFLCIETLTRILLYDSSKGFIYAFKSSYFYFDTNFSGIVIVSLISFSIYIRKRLNVNINKQILFLSILLLLTFSRSAIIAGIISLVVFYRLDKFRFKAYLILLSTLAIFSYMLYQYLYLDVNFRDLDGSFNSKFYIFSIAENLYSSLPYTLKFFGIGMGNTEFYLKIFAHNIYVTFFLEFGIIGSFLFILFVVYSLIISKSFSIILWLPIFICGISLFSAYSPYIFIINAIIISEEINFKSGA